VFLYFRATTLKYVKMLFRTRVANGRAAHPALIKHAIKGWRRTVRGYVTRDIPKIYQDNEAKRFLRGKGAVGCCLAEYLIFCRRTPSKSTICEELIHALQLHLGIYNEVVGRYGNAVAMLALEYVAAKILVQNEIRWHIQVIERKENRMRLRRFSCSIRGDYGGLPWHLRSKLPALINSLGLTLESWMGIYLKVP
jgi:hypothetical protein